MSAIFSGRTSAVVHDIHMTHRADTAEVAKGSAENSTETAANGETTAAAVPAISFGAWPSPITAADVARSRLRLAYPMVIGGEVWWQEARPEEGGRVTVVHRSAGGKLTDVLPAPWNARTRVHEYGGLSYLPVPRASARPAAAGGRAPRGHVILFANYADQPLYVALADVAEDKQAPQPITPDPVTTDPAAAGAGSGAAGTARGLAALRYADFVLSPDRREVWCVREAHSDGKVTRAIVAVPLDGSAADDPAAARELVTGSDFFAFPTPSPDGKRLAWISWNHPHMPWDGTELRVAPITRGGKETVAQGRLVKGGLRESVLAPVWRGSTSPYLAADWAGWVDNYQVGLTGAPPQALYPAEEEFVGPLWHLGGRPFAVLGDGRLAVVHGRGGLRLRPLGPETSELAGPDLPLR